MAALNAVSTPVTSKQTSAPPPVSLSDFLDNVSFTRVQNVVGSDLSSQLPSPLGDFHSNDVTRPRQLGRLNY